MIRTIEKIIINDLSSRVQKVVPMIPASGTYSRDITTEAGGRLSTTNIDFKVSEVLPEMYQDVILTVLFDDGTKVSVGSSDIPATLEIKNSDITRVTCKWKHPAQ